MLTKNKCEYNGSVTRKAWRGSFGSIAKIIIVIIVLCVFASVTTAIFCLLNFIHDDDFVRTTVFPFVLFPHQISALNVKVYKVISII